MKDLDEQMADWKDSVSRQARPYDMEKISRNLKDFRQVFMKRQSLIDVGCGRGSVYHWLGCPKDYIGIDRDPEEIKAAKELHPGARFEVRDLFDLDLKADWVICSRVLMHIPRPFDAIKRLRECGRTVLFVPIGNNAVSRDEFDGGFTYFRTFSRATIKKAGGCRIFDHQPYSTVIYDPLLP